MRQTAKRHRYPQRAEFEITFVDWRKGEIVWGYDGWLTAGNQLMPQFLSDRGLPCCSAAAAAVAVAVAGPLVVQLWTDG